MCALVICESRNIILASIQQTDSNNHTIALTFCSTPHHGTKRLRISQNILLYGSYFTLNFTAGSSIGQGKIEAITHFLPAPMHRITDVESYNHYFGWYGGKIEGNGPWLDKFHAENPDICLGISEYGCEGIINWHSNTPQCKDYTEEYQALYHEYMAQAFEYRPWIWASHIWNMFDFGCATRNEGGVKGRNNKGLVTINRKTRKDSFYVYQAYWAKDPMVHIAGRRHAQRAGEATEVKVYSNQDTVTLYAGGLYRKPERKAY